MSHVSLLAADRPIHYTSLLADLDLNTLLQWEERQQTCMTIQR